MIKDELYEQHIDDMFGENSILKKDYSHEQIDHMLERLINCLPNSGKLYKYRLIDGRSFEYIYNCLRDKYLWLSKPIDLNDDDDTNLNIDLEKDIEILFDFVKENPEKFISFILSEVIKNEEYQKILLENKNDFIRYFNFERQGLTDEEIIKLLLSYGVKYHVAQDQLVKYKKFIFKFKKDIESFAKENTFKLVKLSQEIREKAFVYSMSDSYDIDEMWGHYSNNNGFCIEYDYNKALCMDYKLKRKLINTFKVIYKDKDYFSLVSTFRASIIDDKKMMAEQNKKANLQILTKKVGWSSEREWRLLLENLNDNRLYVDLVSALIIDDRSINTDNARKLINLAKINGWNITIRKRDIYNKHYYESLK